MIANCTEAYAAQKTAIGPNEAVTLTALIGAKGEDFWSCKDVRGGINVLSVGFRPGKQTLWAAWENGAGSTWTPAACNSYIEVDLSSFFASTNDAHDMLALTDNEAE